MVKKSSQVKIVNIAIDGAAPPMTVPQVEELLKDNFNVMDIPLGQEVEVKTETKVWKNTFSDNQLNQDFEPSLNNDEVKEEMKELKSPLSELSEMINVRNHICGLIDTLTVKLTREEIKKIQLKVVELDRFIIDKSLAFNPS